MQLAYADALDADLQYGALEHFVELEQVHGGEAAGFALWQGEIVRLAGAANEAGKGEKVTWQGEEAVAEMTR
ncbi:hypothetical protein CVT26_016159 [Gymnopilus dilepis]|uniref:Uncharacterized protein n=1 Tax=Gymnopilus dilepis TaxID=231916 RepID=A0A409XYT6_9AGAR|nr:hypothetical protein CVT26_016159 [Gymnopilus dilepis]